MNEDGGGNIYGLTPGRIGSQEEIPYIVVPTHSRRLPVIYGTI
jgi:hypothetical protein